VAQCVAGLRGIAVDELAALTRENFFRLFRDAVPADPGEAMGHRHPPLPPA
jgi:TatD DNase family protein